ncbi:gene transfer agent family protein [Methylobacterium sp. JK268]
MSQVDTSRCYVDADFAGQRRRFVLRIGEIAELERLTGSGIGAVFMRIGAHQFTSRDVWDTIRLGLEGGGMDPMEATALCLRYHPPAYPLMTFIPLAGQIVAAAVNGLPDLGKAEAEGSEAGPATSPSSTEPGRSSGGRRRRSTR